MEEMSGSELLDHVDHLAATQRRCELEILKAAVQHAVVNNPNTLDPNLTRLPGRERAVRYGGVGTERVAEFACAEFGARLGVSAASAHSLIADALDLVLRLPRLWARVEALEVKASYARFVARRTRDLPRDQADAVDERVVEAADGRIPWSRFEEHLTAAIAAADPWAAARREHEPARRQYARPTRDSEHGFRGFGIRASCAVIARLDATVQYFADILGALGDEDPVDVRRVKAIAVLANPGHAAQLLTQFQAWRDRPADPPVPTDPDATQPDPDAATPDVDQADPVQDAPVEASVRAGEKPTLDWSKLLPAVQLVVHMYAATPTVPSTGIARVEGVGPVTEQFVKTRLSPQARVTVRPVLDLEGLAPVDAYEIPDAHRRAVEIITPADVFPYAPNTRPGKQIDHTEPYQPGAPPGTGQSRIGNYGPMTGFHHRIKTHGHWQVKQPYPGLYLWRDPHGALYLVDHTGTRRINTAA